MAERKTVNKYYPPDWEPSKGSINKFRNSHPLRERARKLDQGILVIRFELPYNIWCDGCNNHVGMGVRYNAEKSKVGMYYTTPVYKFRMKCHLCDSHFEMQTDPQNLDYTILNGARRQERRWNVVENEQIEVDKEVSKKMSIDPMFKLEHDVIDKSKNLQNKNKIDNLEQFQNRLKDDYLLNCQVRKKFRDSKNELKEIAKSDIDLLKKSSLPISLKLVKEDDKDVKMAKLFKLQLNKSTSENKSRTRIWNQSIFKNSKLRNSHQFQRKDSFKILKNKKQTLADVKIKPTCSSSLVDYHCSDSD